jgi:hypothetical protein
MILREMIADDIPEMAQLYKQFWGEDSKSFITTAF